MYHFLSVIDYMKARKACKNVRDKKCSDCFLEPGNIANIKLYLRRTLVHFVLY
jgi:hypothetical protein